MAEMARQHPQDNAEDIGDVLASIRRLIAQDGFACDPAEMTDSLRRQAIAQAQTRAMPTPAPVMPLVLTSDEMVPPGAENTATENISPDADSPLMTEQDMSQTLLKAVDNPAHDADENPQAATQPRDLNLFTMEDHAAPDEAPLRGLIRDALVQEMQGELGTRMTRNLRHLIRSEIAMALKEATRST